MYENVLVPTFIVVLFVKSIGTPNIFIRYGIGDFFVFHFGCFFHEKHMSNISLTSLCNTYISFNV